MWLLIGLLAGGLFVIGFGIRHEQVSHEMDDETRQDHLVTYGY